MINNVTLVGRLTRDPELVKSQNGTDVAKFGLASDDSRKGPNGERITLFVECVAFGQVSQVIAKYTKRGHLVGIIGRLNTRSFTNKDGATVNRFEIIVKDVELMEPKVKEFPENAPVEHQNKTLDALQTDENGNPILPTSKTFIPKPNYEEIRKIQSEFSEDDEELPF